jgi:hypothetical protein
VGLAHLVRLLVVKLIYLDLIWMLYLRLIILSVGGDVPVDSETFLVTDFVNLKIKSAQSFRSGYRSRIYMCMFIGISVHTCINMYIYIVFLRKIVILRSVSYFGCTCSYLFNVLFFLFRCLCNT